MNVPRTIGGTYGSGGTNDTSVVNNGLSVTRPPRKVNPPSWLNKLLGGPLTRSIDKVIGSSTFQSAKVSRAAMIVEPDVS